MRTQTWIAAALTLLATAARAQNPVVVELFQSQGCSSCPPANANFIAIADRPGVLALAWEVTYWDTLGWKDTFGDRAYTARQYAYATGLGHAEVFTPQIVINGRTDLVGDSPAELETAIRQARPPAGPPITLASDHVAIGAASNPGQTHGEVYLIRYDPALIQVPIAHGENGGRTLPHRNIVRQFVHLGSWQGRNQNFPLPPSTRPNLKTAILVQSAPGGPIISAIHS